MSRLMNFLILSVSLLVMPALFGLLGMRALEERDHPHSLPRMSTNSVATISRPVVDTSKPTVVVLLGADLTEITDALGPYEMFSRAGLYNVVTAAPQRQPTLLTGGLKILPHYSLAEIDSILPKGVSIVVIPNLPNAADIQNKPTIEWITAQAKLGALIHSWCKGAMALAETGLLDGKTATAHWGDIAKLERRYPKITWVRGVRWLEHGQIVMSAGITSGIDASLRVLIRVASDSVARRVAREIRYPNYHFALDPKVEQYEVKPQDAVLYANAAWRPIRPTIGVAMHAGIGELDLSNVFDAHGHTLTARVETVAEQTPLVTQHGLTIYPSVQSTSIEEGTFDRLIVPGVDAEQRGRSLVASIVKAAPALRPEYVHAADSTRFGLEPVIEDLSRTADVPTARFALNRMEFRSTSVRFEGSRLPVWPIAIFITLAAAGPALVLFVRNRRFTHGYAAVLMLLVVVACDRAVAPLPSDPSDPDPVPAPVVATISLDATDLALEEGATRQLTATARDAQGATIPAVAFSWTSTDRGIADVSALGAVSATRSGTTMVTASANGKSAQATVRVSASYAYDLLYTVNTVDIFQEVRRLDLGQADAAPAPLFAPQQWASQPRPSPDGARIAYVCPNPIIGDPSICVANRDGSSSTMIAAFIGEAFQEPVWSPDGRRIAFVRTKFDGTSDQSHIWVMNADGTSQVALTADVAGTQHMPAWSPTLPDGTERIAFVQNVNTQPRIWTMRADGSDRRQLGSLASAYDMYPAWSPDGRTITFQRTTANVNSDIWLMDANGGNERALLAQPLAGAQLAPTWSPDGKLIAFTSSHELTSGSPLYQVYTAWADGSRLARRTFDATEKAAPAWLTVSR